MTVVIRFVLRSVRSNYKIVDTGKRTAFNNNFCSAECHYATLSCFHFAGSVDRKFSGSPQSGKRRIARIPCVNDMTIQIQYRFRCKAQRSGVRKISIQHDRGSNVPNCRHCRKIVYQCIYFRCIVVRKNGISTGIVCRKVPNKYFTGRNGHIAVTDFAKRAVSGYVEYYILANRRVTASCKNTYTVRYVERTTVNNNRVAVRYVNTACNVSRTRDVSIKRTTVDCDRVATSTCRSIRTNNKVVNGRIRTAVDLDLRSVKRHDARFLCFYVTVAVDRQLHVFADYSQRYVIRTLDLVIVQVQNYVVRKLDIILFR